MWSEGGGAEPLLQFNCSGPDSWAVKDSPPVLAVKMRLKVGGSEPDRLTFCSAAWPPTLQLSESLAATYVITCSTGAPVAAKAACL